MYHVSLQRAYEDLRQTQHTVMQQERLRALGQKASAIAHDINNALSQPSLVPEWRLLVITGLCGGLTTFSTFSAEIVAHLVEGRALWACGVAALHLAGSVLMTFAGIGTVAWVKG